MNMPGFTAEVSLYRPATYRRSAKFNHSRIDSGIEGAVVQQYTPPPSQRVVCWIGNVLYGLRCHPLTCMLLKLRFTADSNPSLSAMISAG